MVNRHKVNKNMLRLARRYSIIITGLIGMVCQSAALAMGHAKHAELTGVTVDSFAPIKQQSVSFSYRVVEPGEVSLEIYTPEKTRLAALLEAKPHQRGDYTVTWNGKDQTGNWIPDAAWFPKLTWRHQGISSVDFPAEYSGGEALLNITPRQQKKGVTLNLDAAARVLVRGGIKNGPVLKSFAYWQPYPKGLINIAWDGFDQDGLQYLAEKQDFWLMAMAYHLPKFSVISFGNSHYSWIEYRDKHGLHGSKPNLSDIPFRRSGQRIEKDYFYPREELPQLDLTWLPSTPNQQQTYTTKEKADFVVDVINESLWIKQNPFFEIVVYVNNKFLFEEEQGFLPITAQIDMAELPPGQHVLTVQLVSMTGAGVISRSIPFLLLP